MRVSGGRVTFVHRFKSFCPFALQWRRAFLFLHSKTSYIWPLIFQKNVPMASLIEQIIARANQRTDFQNDELEAIWKAQQERDVRLCSAAYDFQATCDENNLDAVDSAAAFLGLAQVFAEVLPAPTADRKAKIVAFVNELIDDEEGSPKLEAVSEALFSAALDWEIGQTEAIASVNSLIAGLSAE